MFFLCENCSVHVIAMIILITLLGLDFFPSRFEVWLVYIVFFSAKLLGFMRTTTKIPEGFVISSISQNSSISWDLLWNEPATAGRKVFRLFPRDSHRIHIGFASNSHRLRSGSIHRLKAEALFVRKGFSFVVVSSEKLLGHVLTHLGRASSRSSVFGKLITKFIGLIKSITKERLNQLNRNSLFDARS